MVQSFLHIFKGSGRKVILDEIKAKYSLDRDPEKFDGNTVKVKEMRDFLNFAHKKPLDNTDIHLVVFDAHLMSSDVANTMLKTLEEPPNYLYFHLVTNNPHKVLPTILSRCHRLIYGDEVLDVEAVTHDNLFDRITCVKHAVKTETLGDDLFVEAKKAVASGDWIRARVLDRLLNLHTTTNVNVSLAYENFFISEMANVDTEQK